MPSISTNPFQDLPTVRGTTVNHSPGREVIEAHPVTLAVGSRLAAIAASVREKPGEEMVNSSHHQAVARVGDKLRVAALSPGDQVIEAVELDADDHFVLAVQWHPERSYVASSFSRAIFTGFVQAAAAWQPRRIEESISAR
jgi:putative glutamine amidotransferase